MKPISTEHVGKLAAILKERVGLHIRPDGHAALRIAMLARLGLDATGALRGGARHAGCTPGAAHSEWDSRRGGAFLAGKEGA